MKIKFRKAISVLLCFAVVFSFAVIAFPSATAPTDIPTVYVEGYTDDC